MRLQGRARSRGIFASADGRPGQCAGPQLGGHQLECARAMRGVQACRLVLQDLFQHGRTGAAVLADELWGQGELQFLAALWEIRPSHRRCRVNPRFGGSASWKVLRGGAMHRISVRRPLLQDLRQHGSAGAAHVAHELRRRGELWLPSALWARWPSHRGLRVGPRARRAATRQVLCQRFLLLFARHGCRPCHSGGRQLRRQR
mmetsp:Transcript_136164/g.353056  ORF Transcript_136164/g.353056 Transcript_136164/m.353056 type:complete len:202 (+) Transcript_136164:217-822(+)